jgi:oleandomycin transport system permease protein
VRRVTATDLDLSSPARPVEAPQPRPFALVRHSLVLAWRSLLKVRRTPEQLLDVTLQPIIFVVLFVYLFGGAIAGSQHDYLQFVLPALMVQTVLFSSLSIGVNLNTDIKKGVFDRFRSLPIGRAAPLVGAVLGDLIRYVISVVVLVAFGSVIGFRVQTGPLQALAGCLLAIGFAMAISWVAVLVGLLVREPGGVQGFGFLVMFPLTFGSSMFVPPSTLPGWLQAWVKVNPVTSLVDAVRALMIGGPTTGPVIASLLWAAGIVAVFAPIAVAVYRRKT